jgi:HEAT repeat protein
MLGPISAGASGELVAVLSGPPEAIRYGKRPPSVSNVAANTLAIAIGPAAIPALEQGLTHPNQKIRKAAAIVLGKYKPLAGSSLPALVAALDDAILDVRICAIGALGAIGKDAAPALPRLAKFLDSDNFDIRGVGENWRLGRELSNEVDGRPDLQ